MLVSAMTVGFVAYADEPVAEETPVETVEFKTADEDGNVYTGVVGSADIWNREKDKLKYLADKHNVSCEDMELVAVYAVAQNYNIPAVGIKIMSDNELLGEEYEPAVGQYVQEYTYEYLKELVDHIDVLN